MESIDNLMPALPKTDDPDIQELLSVFRNEFLKHKITQEEFIRLYIILFLEPVMTFYY